MDSLAKIGRLLGWRLLGLYEGGVDGDLMGVFDGRLGGEIRWTLGRRLGRQFVWSLAGDLPMKIWS
jgi:hypothetical protein